MNFKTVQTLSNRQRDELARVGRIPRQYDLGAVTFQYDSATGLWSQWQEQLEFLTAGVGENFGPNTGILTTETILNGQNSLDDGGFPSKEFSYLVTGVTFEFGLPYKPSSTSAASTYDSESLRVSSFGALDAHTQNIAEYLVRAAMQNAYLQYVTRNCTFELGPVQELPAGVGINDPKGGPSSFGVQMQGIAPLLRRDPIILPPSDPKYSNEYKFVLNFQSGATSASFPVPQSLSAGGMPSDNDVVAIQVRIYLQGIYGIVNEGTNEFMVADLAEQQILEGQTAQAA